MSAAAKSMVVFGIYLLLLGLTLLIAPNALLVTFGNPPTSEPWIRVLGVVVMLLAYYYARAGREGVVPFFRWTVHTQLAIPVFFVAFVVLGLARATLILFALPDLAGAIWTHLALRAESPNTSSPPIGTSAGAARPTL
jgi:hypothetical protein